VSFLLFFCHLGSGIYSQISGEISFRDMEFRLLKLYGDKNDAVRKELLIACDNNTKCVNERLYQIQQYRQLGAYSRGAETMISIKEMFELSGDFSSVEILVDLVSNSFFAMIFYYLSVGAYSVSTKIKGELSEDCMHLLW